MAKHVNRTAAQPAIAESALVGPSVKLDPEHYAIAKRVGLVTALRETTARAGRVLTHDDFSEFIDAYAVTLGDKRCAYAVTAATRLLAQPTKETRAPEKTRAAKAALTPTTPEPLDEVTDKRLTRVETDLAALTGKVGNLEAGQAEILAILRGQQAATGETVQTEVAQAKPRTTRAKAKATPEAKAEVVALVDAKAKAKASKAPKGAARTVWHSDAYRLILSAGRGKDRAVIWPLVTEGRDAGLTPAKAVRKALAAL